MKIFLVLILMVCFTDCEIYSQEEKPLDNSWLVIGPGVGTNSDLGLTVSYTFTGELLYQCSWDGSVSMKNDKEPINKFGSFSLGIGKKLELKYLLLAGYIGPSFVFGVKDDSDVYSGGLRFGGQLILTPHYGLGIGIDLYTNYNGFKTYDGFRLVLFIRASPPRLR